MSMTRSAAEAASGEALETARRRRKWIIIGGLAAAGFVAGFIAGYSEADGLFDGGTWPPAMALGLAAAYLCAVIGGGIALARQTDEVELAAQYKAVAAAAAVYILAYPVWFLLWMGGLAVEPIHWALFLAFWIGLAGASIYYRIR